MPKESVHIVLSDRGWILEKLAKEISDRYDYVTYDTASNPESAIQYYITYGCRTGRVSPIEAALFTHQEEVPSAKERFVRMAGEIDVAIAMSHATGRILRENGVDCHVISPGVDLDRFVPRIKIGVVGRTYHTGRKGEALVAAVQDVPDIEWHFTGDGWPGPAEHISEERLPEFYRSMDYILVPATIEGGPMCVLEALACGVPIIGSDVGWVSEYPHLAFEKGDAASLRAVLNGIRAERFRLREAVAARTWDDWADRHHALFSDLFQRVPDRTATTVSAPRHVKRAALVLHGVERAALGGPSVRVPETARVLAGEGIRAEVHWSNAPDLADVDVVHGFNIWTTGTAVGLARRVRRHDRPFVFSPILLELRDRDHWAIDIPNVFRRSSSVAEVDGLLDALREKYAWLAQRGALPEPSPDYAERLREIGALSDGFIFLSEKEKALSAAFGTLPPVHRVVRNPVDAEKFGSGDPALFREEFGLEDYVLTVGRIESRKNQLLLAYALNGTGIPLVIVGHSVEPDYEALVRKVAGDNVVFAGRMEPGSPRLLSALAGARVFTLPSFCEGAPLAALEAGAAGANMVLSGRSGESEYFGAFARYCDPTDPRSIKAAILEAWANPFSEEQRSALKAHVRTAFSWERYARETAEVYEEAVRHHAGRTDRREEALTVAEAGRPPQEVVFDVTTNAVHGALKSGITRVERALAQALARTSVKVRFVAWASGGQFQEVPPDVVHSGTIKYFLDMYSDDVAHGTFAPGTPFVVTGSGWMQNNAYAEGLSQFAGLHHLNLCVLIHDLTPTLFPFWYQKGYSNNFNKNFATLMRSADHFLVYSESTKADLQRFAAESDIDLAGISKFRLADELDVVSEEQKSQSARLRDVSKAFGRTNFVLSVGAIHARKNYTLLKDIWVSLARKLGEACPHLIIVGGVSWNGEDIARSLSEDRRIARFVHILDDIDDASLDWLYANCLFTAYPSLYEGWGLPIGESLNYGKVCVASNTSSMNEIAPSLTDLLDPQNRQDWFTTILFYAGSRTARQTREAQIKAQYRTTTWKDSAQSLIEALPLRCRKTERFRYNLGAGVSLGDLRSAVLYKTGGWHGAEKWGSWASERRSSIRLDLVAEDLDEDLVFAAVITSAVKKPRLMCGLSVNGVRVADWHLPAGGAALRSAVIPRSAIGPEGRLVLDFHFDHVRSARELNPTSQDRRNLGLGVSKFILLRPKEPLNLAKWLVHDEQASDELVAGRWLTGGSELFRAGVKAPFAVDGLGARPTSGILSLRLPAAPAVGGLDVTLVVAAEPAGGPPLRINAAVNGIRLDRFALPDDQPRPVRVHVPASAFRTGRPVDLQLSQEEDAARPSFGLLGLRIDRPEMHPSAGPPFLPMGISLSPGNPAYDEFWQGLLSVGWYDPEEVGQWSIAGLGVASFRLSAETRDRLLRLRAARLSTGPASIVEVVSGERVVGVLSFAETAGPQVVSAEAFVDLTELAAEAADDRAVAIAFRGIRPVSPRKLGLSADDRLLGLCLQQIATVHLPTLTTGQRHAAGDRPDTPFQFAGWHEAEPDGRWTAQNAAQLLFRLPNDLHGDEALVLRLVMIANGEPRHVALLAEGKPLAQADLSVEGVYDLVVPVRDLDRSAGAFVALDLTVDRLFRPSEIGLGPDGRLLGLMLHHVEIRDGDTETRSAGMHLLPPPPAFQPDLIAAADPAEWSALPVETLPGSIADVGLRAAADVKQEVDAET